MIHEYEILRNELNQKIEMVNSLITFTLTTVVAILTFALTKQNALFYLLPFCIIIPMYMRIAYYRSAIVKLSAYMIVFLEPKIKELNWETRNACLMNTLKKNDKRIVLRAEYYEGIVVSIICYFLYFYNYIKDKPINIILVVQLIIPFVMVMWMFFIVKHINDIESEKQEWVKAWGKIHIDTDNNKK